LKLDFNNNTSEDSISGEFYGKYEVLINVNEYWQFLKEYYFS